MNVINIVKATLAIAVICCAWLLWATKIPDNLAALQVIVGFAVGFLATILALEQWPPVED